MQIDKKIVFMCISSDEWVALRTGFDTRLKLKADFVICQLAGALIEKASNVFWEGEVTTKSLIITKVRIGFSITVRCNHSPFPITIR